jgi:nitrate/nitrite-specific signal transduction histidine kinase
MTSSNTISKKIKTIGAILFVLMLSIIIATIYLNARNKKDALVINIAGKERMLTQKISKNIFYLYHSDTHDYTELDNATQEFIYNLTSLKNGNELTGIEKVPTDTIAAQIAKVEVLWTNFDNNVQRFKKLLLERDDNNEKIIKNIVNSIYNTNNNLLQEVDNLVTMYTIYTENKTEYIKYFQVGSAFLILILISYSFSQLRTIESNAKKFFEFSKQLVQNPEDEPLQHIKIDAEEEIVAATDTLNCFINKVNSAMDYSAEAIEHSKQASSKLEEITDEFDEVLNELNDSAKLSRHLDKSEDMVIESTEDLINSTKKLQKLRNELDELLKSCQIEKV